MIVQGEIGAKSPAKLGGEIPAKSPAKLGRNWGAPDTPHTPQGCEGAHPPLTGGTPHPALRAFSEVSA